MTSVHINRDNVSEILQIYMSAQCEQTDLAPLALSLKTKAFRAHSPSQKASILAFLVNELCCSKAVIRWDSQVLLIIGHYIQILYILIFTALSWLFCFAHPRCFYVHATSSVTYWLCKQNQPLLLFWSLSRQVEFPRSEGTFGVSCRANSLCVLNAAFIFQLKENTQWQLV